MPAGPYWDDARQRAPAFDPPPPTHRSANHPCGWANPLPAGPSPADNPATERESLRRLYGSRHGERPTKNLPSKSPVERSTRSRKVPNITPWGASSELHTFEESGSNTSTRSQKFLPVPSPRKADQNVSCSLQNRSLRRTSPMARRRRVDRTRRGSVHAQRFRRWCFRRKLQRSRSRVAARSRRHRRPLPARNALHIERHLPLR